MLIKFFVENYLSFKEEVCLDMVASTKHKDHPKYVMEDKKMKKKIPLLRAAAIYGANEAGKSNLIKAILFAKHYMLEGRKKGQTIPVVPFKLDEKTQKEPSKFEFVIKYKGVIYTYGFVVDIHQVHDEWLTAVHNVKEMVYFERTTNEKGKAVVEIGNRLAKKDSKQESFLKDYVARGTLRNQLFLTELMENNVEEVEPIIEWFRNVLTILTPESMYEGLTINLHKDDGFRTYMEKVLRAADTGIDGIVTEERKVDSKELIPIFRNLDRDTEVEFYGKKMRAHQIAEQMERVGDDGKSGIISAHTSHKTTGGKSVLFSLEDESDGTQRFMHIVPVLYLAQKDEKVFIIDEIDRSLHPELSKFFVENYLKMNTDIPGQLIFSTHETHLLDRDLLRRDEINFVRKKQDGSSDIRSLVEYKIRNDLVYSKGYLQGRFDALPFLSDIEQSDYE